MRCPKGKRNFDAFTSSSASEQKESTFTCTVKWYLSVADELTISGSLNTSLIGGVCLNILFPKL